MVQLSLSFLGGFQVTLAGKPITKFESDRVRMLLAYLAMEADRPHRREQLAALLWPDHPEDTARTNLRHILHKLRQALGEPDVASPWLLTTHQTIQFNPASDHKLDVTIFTGLLAICETHLHSGLNRCQDCLYRLSRATALYGGDFLAGLSLAGSAPLEEWALSHQEHLHRQALEAFYHLAGSHEAARNFEEARHYAWRQVELEPWREEAHQQLMRILVHTGQRSAALAQYETCRQILAAELGVPPLAETTALYEQIQFSEELGKNEVSLSPLSPPSSAPVADWGELPTVSSFYGRQSELATLERWLITDRCRVVVVLGMGGIGKTALVAKCTKALADQFDFVFWRSLLHAPLLADILRSCFRLLSVQIPVNLPNSLDDQFALLLDYLGHHRCLLILDNIESIMQGGNRTGTYRPDYEDYGQLVQRLADGEHQSCLLLTSRERPKGLTRLETDISLVRSLQLAGLEAKASQELLRTAGLTGPAGLTAALLDCHSSNPLALKLAARTIQELFGGDIAAFLDEGAPIFDDIRDALDQQFGRLPALEQEILIWLAIEREALSTQELWDKLVRPGSRRALLEALRSLQRRSLLNTVPNKAGFTLPNVVTEFLTNYLIEQACQEIEEGRLHLLNRHALIKAQAKEYVRQSQVRLILQPIGWQLMANLGKAELEERFRHLFDNLHAEAPLAPGYARGNLLNLALHLSLDVQFYDFSRLVIWQAYLPEVTLRDINFVQADLVQPVLTGTFDSVSPVAFSLDGQLLATGTLHGDIQLWRVADRQLVRIIKGHSNFVGALAFGPDGALLATGSADQTICLWDTRTGQIRHTLQGHNHWVWSVAFSPDGKTLASGSADETVKLWDVDTGECRWTFHAPGSYAGMNIASVIGLTEAQQAALKALGAVEEVEERLY